MNGLVLGLMPSEGAIDDFFVRSSCGPAKCLLGKDRVGVHDGWIA
jgi:hypothetical protein